MILDLLVTKETVNRDHLFYDAIYLFHMKILPERLYVKESAVC